MLVLRCVAPQDREGVIQLIDSVYREYGDRVCLENADADLLDLSAHYGRGFVVLQHQQRIAGCHAVAPTPDRGVCTFRRLYLAPDLRGAGRGRLLMDWALRWASRRGYRRVEFWSDSRFHRAHAFFQRLGFQHDGRIREMHDAHQPYQELFFGRDLDDPS